MKPNIIIASFLGALVALLLSSVPSSTPKTLECSIDDELVFVAFNVVSWNHQGNIVDATNQDGTRLVRQMLPNETCVDREP